MRGYLILLVLVSMLAPGVGVAQSESDRVYVRRIEFENASGIADSVLRRELLLLEGTFLNTEALEQSRVQLERLPYIESTQVLLRAVDGALNQVDVVILLDQAPARAYGGGGGYSESQRVSVHGFFTHENIFGTGQRFSASTNVSDFRTLAELSHTNPFIGSARISRTISLASRQVDRLTADTTEVEADLASARLEFGYRTGERQTIALGLAFSDVDLTTQAIASDQWLDWLQRNGNPTMKGPAFATDFLASELLFRWRRDTRIGRVFPESGVEQAVTVRAAIPASEVDYYSVDFELTKHWPLPGGWEARLDAKLGYGAAYGPDTSSLPPYLNWFAGGPGSVRGYRESGLGPRDSLGNPYGGNLFLSSQLELMVPLPEKWRERMRVGVFYDFGGAFSTEDVVFLDDMGATVDYGFDASRLRRSAGVSARVLLPIGMVRLSYGVPLNAEDRHPNRFLRDDIEQFQVAIEVDF